MPDFSAPKEATVIPHPWEDVATVMRHANRARAAGDLQRACTFYTRAIELNPNFAEAWEGKASTTSNLDEAIVAWGYALALAPNSEAQAMLSACITEKIKPADAEQVASLVEVGQRLAEAGQSLAARRLFVCATERDSTNEEAWMWRAGVTDDVTESITCLKRVLELNPQNAQAQAGLRWATAKQSPVPATGDAVA